MSIPILSLGNKTPEQLKVAELREELKKRGINIKGLKKDLVERLDEILRQEAAEAQDQSRKICPEDVSNDEDTSPLPEGVDVDGERTQEETCALPNRGQGKVGSGLNDFLPSNEDLFGLGTERKLLKPKEVLKQEVEVFDILKDVSVSTSESRPLVKCDEKFELEPTLVSTVDACSEGSLLLSGIQREPGEVRCEKGASGRSGDVKEVMLENVARQECEDEILPNTRLHTLFGQLKPARDSCSTSSADARLSDASEVLHITTEIPCVAEEALAEIHGEGCLFDIMESVVEETRAEPINVSPVETLTVCREPTDVTTEIIVISETEPDFSTGAAGQGNGSLTCRNAGARTSSLEGSDKGEVTVGRNKNKHEGLDLEEYGKRKALKYEATDFDSLTVVKQRDEDELRYQEPSKRQRRWISEKSTHKGVNVQVSPKVMAVGPDAKEGAGQGADAQVPPKVVAVGHDPKEVVQPSVARSFLSSPSEASKASATFNIHNPASSRPGLSTLEVAVGGEPGKIRQVPPTLRAPTLSLKIDRFVRPFTIKAVRELLEQTGTVKEMWMDQIKTHCYVTFSSVEEAINTRNALYHLQWPVAGGKLLVAEFVEPEEVKLRLNGVTDKSTSTALNILQGSENISTHVISPVFLPPAVAHVPITATLRQAHLPLPPGERPVSISKNDQGPPIPTLDDLYKKTRTKPQIYFLPLTDEQVAAKIVNKQTMSRIPVKT